MKEKPERESAGRGRMSPALAIFLSALTVRAVWVGVVIGTDAVELSSDMWAYDRSALCLARSEALPERWYFNCYHPLSASTYYPPGYTYFLALIYRMSGYRHWVVLEVQALLGALSALLTYQVAKRLGEEKMGIFAGFSFAFYLPLVYYTGVLLTETLYIFLVCLWLWILLRRGGARSFLVSGVVLGLASLTRPQALLGGALLLPALFFCLRNLKGSIKFFFCHSITLALVILPVTIRNYQIHGQFILISTNGAPTFYFGHIMKSMEMRIPPGMDDNDLRNWATVQNIKWLKRNLPGYLWELPEYYSAVFLGGNFWPARGLLREVLSRADNLFWKLFFFPLGICGLTQLRKFPREFAYIAVVLAIHFVLPAIAPPFPRYRLPIFPAVAILSWVTLKRLL